MKNEYGFIGVERPGYFTKFGKVINAVTFNIFSRSVMRSNVFYCPPVLDKYGKMFKETFCSKETVSKIYNELS